MEFTKGEWHVTNSAFSRWNAYRGKVTGARTFVTVGIELDQVAEVHGNTDEECEANARLIAAAPKMYEACKAVDDYLLPKVMFELVEQVLAEVKKEVK